MKSYGNNYKNYYLVKCFEHEAFRRDFNDGKIYLNPLSVYSNLENQFQQDKEGVIFSQSNESSGGLYALDRTNSEMVSQLMKSGNISQGFDLLIKSGYKLAETKDVKICVSGFLCCFYIIPQECLQITEQGITISPPNEYNNFLKFLNCYSEKQGYSFVSVYDAEKLIDQIYTCFHQKGFNISAGCVSYEDVDDETKIKWYSDNQIDKLIFTKPLKFEYQKEFRLFFYSVKQKADKPITIEIEPFSDIILSSFSYLTPKYCWKIKGE